MSAMHQQHPITFTGNAREYFGIWIVNLFLSIITLGVYSAWAKVRRKKYFYHNTQIDGVGFDYHADPVSILKGRFIAVSFFLIYSLSQKTMPLLSLACGFIFLIALPWIIVRANTFNARNTSHRGLRFNFTGTMKESIRVFIGLPMLIPFTLGLIYPYISQQRTKFLATHHKFGTTAFGMEAKSGEFYKVYFKALGVTVLVLFGLGVLAAVLVGVGIAGNPHKPDAMKTIGILAALLIYIVALLVMVAYLQARLGNLIWNSANLDTLVFESSLRARDMAWIYLTNMVAIACSFGLMTPWAHIRTIKYRAEHLAIVGDVDFDRFVADKKEEMKATGEEIADMFDVDLAF